MSPEPLRASSHVARPVAAPPRRGGLIALLLIGLAGCAPTTAARVGGDVAEAGDSIAGSYLAGRAALAGGDVVTAARELARTAAENPGELGLRREVLLLDLVAADGARAVEDARALVEVDPAAPEARLVLAAAELRAGRAGACRDQLAPAQEPSLVSILRPILDAWCLDAGGDRAGAERLLARGTAGAPVDPLRVYHHAALLGLLGRAGEGVALLEGLIASEGRPPARMMVTLLALEAQARGAAAALQRLDATDPVGTEEPLVEAARAELADGRVPTAPIRDATSGFADALLGLADAIRAQDPVRALALARLAIDLAPADLEAHLLTAEVFVDQGNPAAALRALDASPSGGPLGLRRELARAEALAALDRRPEAEAVLRAAIASYPRRPEPLIALGDLLRRQDRFAEAVAAYGEVIDRLSAAGLPVPWRLYYVRGIALDRSDRWPEAERDFLAALELEPDQATVLNYLGYSWVDRGMNLERAQAMLRRAVELSPNDGFIVDSLGWAHYRLGDYQEAVVHLERAVELQPGDPVLNDHLGDAYWRAGRQREARFQWERVLIFSPEPELAAEVRRKLERGLPDARGG
jgi:tetratricopeptide (TPR) repeat protein